MYLIKTIPFEDGSRPPLQTWDFLTVPEGYYLCPEELHDIFYSTSPAGFVNITVENNIVTSMSINQKALDTYVASLPKPSDSLENEKSETPVDPIIVLQEENKQLKAKITTLEERSMMLEECIVEMANKIYE